MNCSFIILSRPFRKGILPIAIFLSISFFGSYTAFAESGFQIVGARSLYFGGLRDLAKDYERKTGIKIFTKAGGCKAASKGMEIPGTKFIGAWCCPVPYELAKKNGIVKIPIAMDAIAIYVHPSNPVDNISAEELKNIYMGKLKNWSSLGGPNKPIVPVYRRHCSNLQELFRVEIIGSQVNAYETADWLEVKSIEKMIESVEKFPLAIGYESNVFAKGNLVKILKVGGVFPDATNIQNKKYPFWRTLHLTVKEGFEEDWEIKGFLDYSFSGSGRKILNKKLVALSRGGS
jgi:phosphate transport system substrate-binding protein